MYVSDADRAIDHTKTARHIVQSGDFSTSELNETEKHALGLILDIRTRRQCLRHKAVIRGKTQK